MEPAEQDTGAEAATAALGEEMLTHWVIQMKAAGSESATCHSCHNSGPLEPLPLGVAKARKRAGTQVSRPSSLLRVPSTTSTRAPSLIVRRVP